MRNPKFVSGLSRLLAALMLVASVVAPAQAAMMETESLAQPAPATDARTALVDKLVSLGVDQGNAETRVALLSNEQAAQVLAQSEQLPAGAGALEILGLIVIILIVTDLLGITDIFPFIDKVGN